jgi:hypothetical protein
VSIIPIIVPVPVTYSVSPGSIADFVQTGSAPFSDYAFSYDYISGFGTSLRNTGGKSNTSYKPAGGNLKATFTFGTDNPINFNCDLTYKEI